MPLRGHYRRCHDAQYSGGYTLAGNLDILGNYQILGATLARRHPEVTLLTTKQNVPRLTSDRIAVAGILQGGAVSSVHHRGRTSTAIHLSGIQPL